VKFIVNKEDAHIVRAHYWWLKFVPRGNSYYITRAAPGSVSGLKITLAQDILGVQNKKIFHENCDALDFRKENLSVALGDGITKCIRGHDLLNGGSYNMKNSKLQCKICNAEAGRKSRAKHRSTPGLTNA